MLFAETQGQGRAVRKIAGVAQREGLRDAILNFMGRQAEPFQGKSDFVENRVFEKLPLRVLEQQTGLAEKFLRPGRLNSHNFDMTGPNLDQPA